MHISDIVKTSTPIQQQTAFSNPATVAKEQEINTLVMITDEQYLHGYANMKNTPITNALASSVSPNISLRDDICFSIGSCENALNKKEWFCYCDEKCEEFQDCCHDFYHLSTK